MSTTVENIRAWLGGRETHHSHMLVVTDTFDYCDYPVYVSNDQDIHEIVSSYPKNMQKLTEVYNLSMDIDLQLKERRCYNL